MSSKIVLIAGLLLVIILGNFKLAQARGSLSKNTDKSLVTPETQRRLREVEHTRQELHERASQARKKEQLALVQLKNIQSRLNATANVLAVHQGRLKKTTRKISETENNLEQTENRQTELTTQAGARLREIYEGQRLTLLEMIFQVQSLQSLLDLFYYQERVADMDRTMLNQLKYQAQTLYARKQKLSQQKNILGDLISEFAHKALLINREKDYQEQIAKKLKSQRAFYEQAERQLAMESQQLERQIIDMESANKKSVKKIEKGSGILAFPLQVKAPITSPFGWRRHPIFGVRKFHSGLDLAGPYQATVKAADSGNVLYTGWYGGYGKVVIISHGKSMATLYAHLSGTAVNSGQNVSKGQLIGYEGTTGFSTGPHLHFEVRINGKPTDPLPYLH